MRTALETRERPVDPEILENAQKQAVGSMSFEAARIFARHVWGQERPDEPMVQVGRQEDFSDTMREAMFSPDAAAEARWDRPYADSLELPRLGKLAGTSGPVPYIDLTDEALHKTTILHELAHLLVDTEDTHLGHREEWASAFGDLLSRHVHEFTAEAWRRLWESQNQSDAERAARDPSWARGLLRPKE